MANVSEMSDAELLAHYAMPGLIAQESGGRAGVLGPQTKYGRAEGMTQMLPATAKATAERIGLPWRPELMRGTTPEAAAYQEQLGRAYLQEGIEKTGNLQDGLRYYHGGPNRDLWGPKTQGYVDQVSQRLRYAPPEAPADLSGMSDAELLALYQGAPAAAPAPKSSAVPAAPGRPPQRAAAPVRQDPTIAQDAASGFAQPFRDLADAAGGWLDRSRQKLASPPKPASVGEFFGGMLDDAKAGARVLGSAIALPSAPIQAVIRPTASAIERTAGGPTVAPQFTFEGGKIGVTALRKLEGQEARAAIEGMLNTALSGARPATVRPAAVPKPKPVSVEDLKTASDAAWKRVDASGYKFPQPEVQSAAADIAKIVRDADPDLYPEAAKVAAKVQRMAGRGELTPAQANRLRSQIGEKLLGPGSTEVSVGGEIKARIDALIDAGNAPELKEARKLYTQLKKAEEVVKRTDSAELRAASTYAGGNQANATRQNLRPLIDPKSPQRLRNLTPDEAKALRKVVDGSGGANLARVTGKMLDPRGLLGASVQTMFGIPSAGLSTVSIPLGMFGSSMSNRMTAKAADDLLKLITSGGVKPKPIPIAPIAGPYRPLTGPTRLLGAGVVAAPATRAAKAPPRDKAGAKAKAR